MADYRLKKSSIIQNSYMWIKLTINITWTKTKKKIYIYRKHIITLKSGKCCLQQHVNTNDHQFAVCIKCCVNKTIPTIFLSVFTIAYFVTFVLPSKKKKLAGQSSHSWRNSNIALKINMGNEKSCGTTYTTEFGTNKIGYQLKSNHHLVALIQKSI